MSIDRDDIDDGARGGASQLLARAVASIGRADRALAAATDDFMLPDDLRLDDRTRAVLSVTLAAIVEAIEEGMRRHAARGLEGALAEQVATGAPVLARLIASGVICDADLMRELLARTRQDLLADTLPPTAPDDPGAGSLLARLSGSADDQVASAARALMAAESRRRDFLDTGRLRHSELPAELHHRLVWWIAAAVREQVGPGADRALADAATAALASHDEGDRVESAAVRLAAAIDAQPGELPLLLTHAIGGRNVALFAALLARALRTDFAAGRELIVTARDPLWAALRAVDLDRATIARVGLALGGDVETFADRIDAIMAVTPDAARAAIAPLLLPLEFRAAAKQLGATR